VEAPWKRRPCKVAPPQVSPVQDLGSSGPGLGARSVTTTRPGRRGRRGARPPPPPMCCTKRLEPVFLFQPTGGRLGWVLGQAGPSVGRFGIKHPNTQPNTTKRPICKRCRIPQPLWRHKTFGASVSFPTHWRPVRMGPGPSRGFGGSIRHQTPEYTTEYYQDSI